MRRHSSWHGYSGTRSARSFSHPSRGLRAAKQPSRTYWPGEDTPDAPARAAGPRLLGRGLATGQAVTLRPNRSLHLTRLRDLLSVAHCALLSQTGVAAGRVGGSFGGGGRSG